VPSANNRHPKTHVYKSVNGLDIKADVWRVGEGANRPTVMWIHGGALILGSRKGRFPPALRNGPDASRLRYRLDRLPPGPGNKGCLPIIDDPAGRLQLGADRRTKSGSAWIPNAWRPPAGSAGVVTSLLMTGFCVKSPALAH